MDVQGGVRGVDVFDVGGVLARALAPGQLRPCTGCEPQPPLPPGFEPHSQPPTTGSVHDVGRRGRETP